MERSKQSAGASAKTGIAEGAGGACAMIMAQVSLYPLRQEAISPAIMRVVEILGRHHLEVRMGEMSTMIRGDEGEVFAAIQEAFHAAAALGDAVMTVTISNACPAPKER